jgi:hypothetical protein
MPVNDWTQVDAGIFHAFHHNWISAIANVLNEGLLPTDYYALPEQHAAGFGPDVLALQSTAGDDNGSDASETGSGSTLLLTKPTFAPTAETDLEFYRRKQNAIVVRHVSGDRVAAMVEIVSPGNKSTRHAMRSFVDKAAILLDQGVHLLILDLFPPGPRDPHGLHAAIWEEIAGEEVEAAKKPLTLAGYESSLSVRAYLKPVAVGDVLPDMPLFLEPGACVITPLESTYQTAFHSMPRRWRQVLENSSVASSANPD